MSNYPISYYIVSHHPIALHSKKASISRHHIQSHTIPSPIISYVLYHICHPIQSDLISFRPILSYHMYILFMSPRHIVSILFDRPTQSVCFQYALHNSFIEAYQPAQHTQHVQSYVLERIKVHVNIPNGPTHACTLAHTT